MLMQLQLQGFCDVEDPHRELPAMHSYLDSENTRQLRHEHKEELRSRGQELWDIVRIAFKEHKFGSHVRRQTCAQQKMANAFWWGDVPADGSESSVDIVHGDTDEPLPKSTMSFSESPRRHTKMPSVRGTTMFFRVLSIVQQQERCAQVYESRWFQLVSSVVILINGLLMWVWVDVEHTDTAELIVEIPFTLFFVAELAIELGAKGLRYFRSFLAVVEGASILMSVAHILGASDSSGVLQFAVTVRLFRALRLLRVVPYLSNLAPLQLLVRGLRYSLRLLGWTSLILAITVYISAVAITNIAAVHKDGGVDAYIVTRESRFSIDAFLGTVPRSMFTLFQVMTFEGWASEIVRPYSEALRETGHQTFLVTTFFVIFLTLCGIGVRNLITSVFIIQTLLAKKDTLRELSQSQEAKERVAAKAASAQMRLYDDDNSGTLDVEEFMVALDDPLVQNWMDLVHLHKDEAMLLWDLMDTSDSGKIPLGEVESALDKIHLSARSSDLMQIHHTDAALIRGLRHCTKATLTLMKNIDTNIRNLQCHVLIATKTGEPAWNKICRKMLHAVKNDVSEVASFRTSILPAKTTSGRLSGSIIQSEYDASLMSELEQLLRSSWWRQVANNPGFQGFVHGCIMVNAVTTGIFTDTEADTVEFTVEVIFTLVYSLEIFVRLRAFGKQFFKSKLNVFEAVLVLGAIVDLGIAAAGTVSGGTMTMIVSMFRSLRLLRLTRLLRGLRNARELRLMLAGFYSSARTIWWCAVVVLLVMYISAVLITRVLQVGRAPSASEVLYGDIHSSDRELGGYTRATYFGTIVNGIFTLVQIATTETWGEDIVQKLIQDGYNLHFVQWSFKLYVFLIVYCVFNVAVSAFVHQTTSAHQEDEAERLRQIRRDKQQYVDKLTQLFEDADEDESGTMTYKEFCAMLKKPALSEQLEELEITVSEAKELWDAIDADQTGEVVVQDFVQGCLRAQGTPDALDVMALSTNDLMMAAELVRSEKACDALDMIAKKQCQKMTGMLEALAVASQKCVERWKTRNLAYAAEEHEKWKVERRQRRAQQKLEKMQMRLEQTHKSKRPLNLQREKDSLVSLMVTGETDRREVETAAPILVENSTFTIYRDGAAAVRTLDEAIDLEVARARAVQERAHHSERAGD